MKIRTVDTNGDWNLGKGLSDYAVDEKAIDQNIQSRILSWVGDCFFALQEGVDWLGRLDIGQEPALVEELKTIIIQSFGVVGINSIQTVYDSKTRKIAVTYDIQTIFTPSFRRTLEQAAGATVN